MSQDPSHAPRLPAARRRRLLAGLAAAGVAAALPLRARSAALPRVAVIGGGMAGVATAWLLDGVCDVQLFEARDSIGGNVRTLPITLDGTTYAVDIGAQYFHPGPYPTYVQLLEELGLWPTSTGKSHAFTASITLDDPTQSNPLFVSPELPGRVWPIAADWNRSGLLAFQTTFKAAQRREARDAAWGVSLGDWLATLPISAAEADTMIIPWAASLNSGDIAQARDMSARATMVFAAGALPSSPTDPILYYVLDNGMIEPLNLMVGQYGTVQVHVGTAVEAVQARAGGGYTVQPDGLAAVDVDAVVFAASGPPTLALLQGLPGTALQQRALQGFTFYDATLALHTDPAYVRSDTRLWSFLNAQVNGTTCEASMWMDPVLGTSGLWKSWVTHRAPPAAPVATASFKHVLPDVDGVAAQRLLAGLQGRGGLWFAGGYTQSFDSQETALRSAMTVAEGISGGGTMRTRRLRAA